MGLMLVFVLIIITAMVLNYITQKDFISPTFLGLSSFFITSVLVILNAENWMVDVSLLFFFTILIAMASLITGTYFIRRRRPHYSANSEKFHRNNSKKHYPTSTRKYIRKYPSKTILALSLLLFAIFVIYLRDFIFSSGSISSILRNIYESGFTSEGGHFLFHQIEKMIVAIGYVSYFHILNVIFSFDIKRKYKPRRIILSLIPILISLVTMLIATDRNVVIRFFIYALALWILFFQRSPKRKLKKSNGIILSCTIVLVLIMILVFYGLGKIKNYTSNFERMIGIWGGSGLYNFNLYVNEFDGNYTLGMSTFKSLIGVFASLGFVDSQSIIGDAGTVIFVSNNGYIYASNIHSGFQPFYQDFGIVGVALFTFLMGVFFEFLYQKTYKRYCGFSWVFYAAFLYPLIYMCIADQFYARLHLGLLYEVFWLSVFYYITYGRNKVKRVRTKKKKTENKVLVYESISN